MLAIRTAATTPVPPPPQDLASAYLGKVAFPQVNPVTTLAVDPFEAYACAFCAIPRVSKVDLLHQFHVQTQMLWGATAAARTYGNLLLFARCDYASRPTFFIDSNARWHHLVKDTLTFVSSKDETTDPTLLTSMLDSIFGKPTTDPLKGYDEYNQRNWDGYDAEPITPETLRYARRLLKLMPDTFGPPDIAPSADGSIGLEWVPDDGPLHKLFLDIGPGEVWRGYWKRRNGEFGRLPGTGLNSDTKQVLRNLFDELSI